MDRDAFERRQVFQRQSAGHGHFKAHIGQPFNRGNITSPRHTCGLRVTAAVINPPAEYPHHAAAALFGSITGQFDLRRR